MFGIPLVSVENIYLFQVYDGFCDDGFYRMNTNDGTCSYKWETPVFDGRSDLTLFNGEIY